MQEGLEENKPTRESNKAYREGKRERAKSTRIQGRKEKQTEKFNKALAEDDAETGFVAPNAVEVQNKVKAEEAEKSSRFAKALAKDDIRTSSAPAPVKKSGEAILKAVVSDPDATYSDLTETRDLVNTANKEEEKVIAQADKAAIGIANQAEAMADVETVYDQTRALPGSGGTMANIMGGSGDNRPTAEQYYTKADFEREVARLASQEKQDAPDIAIDKIGLEDYYPNIGKDIAAGTYSGKYIGSATIFSAPGARLPMGLYDARKRAIRDAAQEQQKTMDKLYELPNAPTQFNEAYQADYIDWQTKTLDEAGSYEAFISNPDNRKEMARRMNLGKQMTEIDTRVEALKKSWQPADGKQGVYIPPKLRKKILEWETGKVDNLEDILSGKVNASEFNNYIKSYSNGVIWADENMKNWNDTTTELPMNLKTNKALTSEQLGELNNARQAFKDQSIDYDTYVGVIKKYVSIDVAPMVDSWADLSGYDVDDEARETLKDYISSQIKDESLVANFEMQANKNYEYWAKKYDRANELEDKKTLYTQFYENAINKGIDQKLAGAREQIKAKPGATTEEKTGIMASTLSGLGWDVTKEYKKDKNGKAIAGYVYHRDVLTGGERKPYSLGKEAAKIELYNKTTKKREFVSIEYANSHRDGYMIVGDVKEVLDGYKSNQDIKVINSERRSYPSYTGNDGNIYKASTESLGSYTSASKKSIYTETIGAPVKSVPKRDADGNHLRDENTGELLYDNKKMDVKISWGAQLDDENQRNAIDTQASKDRQWEAGYKP
jgi:hypothetical protein